MATYFGDPYWYCRNMDGTINQDALAAPTWFNNNAINQEDLFWPFAEFDDGFIVRENNKEIIQALLYDLEREKDPEKQADMILDAAKAIDDSRDAELMKKISDMLDNLSRKGI